jgi:hypothetical protein
MTYEVFPQQGIHSEQCHITEKHRLYTNLLLLHVLTPIQPSLGNIDILMGKCRPFNFLNLGTPCNFPEVYFVFYVMRITFLPFDCRPKSGPFAF